MKFVRKAVVLLLAAAMLFSFCACASGAEKTVLFSYEGTDFYSGTFSYMLSSEKAYYEQQFAYINYYYSGANLGWSSVLDEETGMTYADAVWESLVLNAKRMVIVNHLLKQYNLKLTDESAVSTIEGYIEQDMEDYGDGNEYGLNLFYADYGVDIDMVRDYYLNNASLSVLRDYLYGDNGIQKIAADAVRESFDEQYYKVESIFFNYYTDTGSTTLKTPEGVTDEAIAEYFKENYVKVRHILFKTVDDSRNPLPDDQIAVKKAEAQELYDRIVAGETTIDDNYSKSEDGGSTTYPDGYVFTYDEMVEEFEEAAFEMEVGEYRLVETSNGWHIMCKEELEDDDIEGTSISGSTKIETACKTALTKKLIGEQAAAFYEQIKSGEAEFADGGDDAAYAYDAGTVFKTGESDEALEEAALALKTGETALVTVDAYGVYIIKRVDTTDEDFNAKYSAVESTLIDEAYVEYLDSFVDSVTVNEEELAKYDINTAKALGSA